MKVKCDGCNKSVDALEISSFEGKVLCRSCHPVVQFTPTDFEINGITITMLDLGYKEDISPEGIQVWRRFNIKVNNKNSNSLKWISIGVIIQSSEEEKSYTQSIRDGNSQTNVHKHIVTHTYKADFLINQEIESLTTLSRENFGIKDDRPVRNFSGLHIYNIYGEFINGEKFNEIVYQKRIDFSGTHTSVEISSSVCFITTATFGDCNHPMVVEFRNFRDYTLINYNFGKSFIKWYEKNGPIAADFLERHPFFKIISRAILYPIAQCIRFFRLAKSTSR
jgi:hypothetical protein